MVNFIKNKIICKPNSVFDGYLSRRIVADTLERFDGTANN